ncbi:MAG: hypothetical protein N3D84_00680 [Candidatus Woesearchaeota archaeon]|nr:hypothetical protein [Candidatus Woesearchaeota archaeon]
MIDNLRNAKEELKRADHLIYVSLKYTRTCDIFKSIIERLINALDFIFNAMLKKLENEKKISSIPSQPISKCNLVREKFNDDIVKEVTDFYIWLRQVNKSPFNRLREFRRHVTMEVEIDGKKAEINIDNITEYYKKTKVFFDYVEKIIKKEKEEK